MSYLFKDDKAFILLCVVKIYPTNAIYNNNDDDDYNGNCIMIVMINVVKKTTSLKPSFRRVQVGY